MLTGDRLETAESVSYACRLIEEDYKKLYLTFGEDIDAQYHEVSSAIRHYMESNLKIALILQGDMICKSPLRS